MSLLRAFLVLLLLVSCGVAPWGVGVSAQTNQQTAVASAEADRTPAIRKAPRSDIPDWEPFLLSIYENSEEAAVSMEEAYEHLLTLAQQPLDVNTATAEELLTIPGLTTAQVDDIISYRAKYGSMKTIEELLLIPSIDDLMCHFITHFLVAEIPSQVPWYSKEVLSKKLHSIGNTVTATSSIPTYQRKGDIDGSYLGSPLSHSLRYTLSMGSPVHLNISAGKTAGEPFAAHGNMLYDTYSYNLTVRRLGIFRTIILGTFRGQFGMGLTLNNSFTLSKQAMLSSVGRLTTSFSPYSGLSDDAALRGAAVMVHLSSSLQLATYVSLQDADATLNADSTISTILSSPYHRTTGDMAKKHNSSLFSYGAHLRYFGTSRRQCCWGIGASFVRTAFSPEVNPVYSRADTIPASRRYRLYYPAGTSTWNASIDYTLAFGDFHLAGELATCDRSPHDVSGSLPLATLNSVLWTVSNRVSMSAVQRYYSYRYHSYYGRTFGENSNVTNESGLYFTVQWYILPRLSLSAFTDYATFPWYRYQQSADTRSWDNGLVLTYDPYESWTLSARYRLKDKDNLRQSLRLLSVYSTDHLQLRTQIEGCLVASDTTHHGVILSQSVNAQVHPFFTIYGNAAYFNTSDYSARLYGYERGMLYSFSNTSYFGRGYHAALLLTYHVTRRLKVMAKVSHTRYTDRDAIASSYRTIYSNNQTDIEVQLRVKM